ncbi:hypothetical protein EBQ34_01105 [Vandammella animalimorsus]|uniref:Rha family transcriptional regulator n=1 Tax=Vandammella animalimorsus TaxID=2029117 RepID=A0A3M6RTY4_9BURK|nr:Rha family transcriptional regulator [Vandammella animalimorsus]RMX18983.1 hypothetical protein EBQ34_01105 [Vandammella animalimorsus]
MTHTALAAQAVLHTVFASEDGSLKTNSRFVAEVFGRRHDDVLKAARNLECSEEFRLRNFAESSYLNAQNKEQPMVEMTFDGFTLLVMGFTGAKAMAFKEAYIAEFNRMRAELAQRQQAQHEEQLHAEREKAAAQLQAERERAAYFEKYARLPILPLTEMMRVKVHRLLAERTPVADVARICRCSQATVRMLRDAQAKAATADLFTPAQGEQA